MDNYDGHSKFYIYGDTYLKRLCPLMKKKLKIEVQNELVLEGATARRLHAKLYKIYKKENWEKKTSKNNDVVVIMVGTYDIMKFKKSDEFRKFSKQLCRNLTLLVSFLANYHKHIILLTALPVLKMQEQKEHWLLLKKYNENIKRLARRRNVRMVDLFSIFLKTLDPPRCNSRFYLYGSCPSRDVHVMWNTYGMKIALNYVQEADNLIRPCPFSHFIRKEMTFLIGHKDFLFHWFISLCFTFSSENEHIICL